MERHPLSTSTLGSPALAQAFNEAEAWMARAMALDPQSMDMRMSNNLIVAQNPRTAMARRREALQELLVVVQSPAAPDTWRALARHVVDTARRVHGV